MAVLFDVLTALPLLTTKHVPVFSLHDHNQTSYRRQSPEKYVQTTKLINLIPTSCRAIVSKNFHRLDMNFLPKLFLHVKSKHFYIKYVC